jgi:hypothetical protein
MQMELIPCINMYCLQLKLFEYFFGLFSMNLNSENAYLHGRCIISDLLKNFNLTFYFIWQAYLTILFCTVNIFVV